MSFAQRHLTVLFGTESRDDFDAIKVAEIVRNTMPRDRQRATLHHDPQYYRIRNHLVDFLVQRSKERSHGRAPKCPPEVSPGLDNSGEATEPVVRTPPSPVPLRPAKNCDKTPCRRIPRLFGNILFL